MIDIHCHILDGVDDGAYSLSESVEMARVARESGTAQIIADNPDLQAFEDFPELLEAIRAVCD